MVLTTCLTLSHSPTTGSQLNLGQPLFLAVLIILRKETSANQSKLLFLVRTMRPHWHLTTWNITSENGQVVCYRWSNLWSSQRNGCRCCGKEFCPRHFGWWHPSMLDSGSRLLVWVQLPTLPLRSACWLIHLFMVVGDALPTLGLSLFFITSVGPNSDTTHNNRDSHSLCDHDR